MANLAQRPRAFVLMPFDREFAAIYEQLIRPSLEDAAYEPWRADSFLDQQNILRDIVRGIATAHLVVADLTTLNANVLYELGLAHGLRVPTVLLAQSIDEVPFDLRSYRIVTYSTQFDQVGKLKDGLREIAEKHAAGQIRFGSPIIDFLSVESDAAAARSTNLSYDEPPLPSDGDEQQDDEPGFLDALVEANDAAEAIEHFFLALSEETNTATQNMNSQTTRLQAASQAGDAGAARRMLGIAHEISRGVTEYGERVSELLVPFEESLDTLIDRFERALRVVDISSEEDFKSVNDAQNTIAGLLDATRENLDTVRESRRLMNELGAGASRELARAGRRVAAVLDRYLGGLERLEAFAVRTLGVYADHIADWEQRSSED